MTVRGAAACATFLALVAACDGPSATATNDAHEARAAQEKIAKLTQERDQLSTDNATLKTALQACQETDQAQWSAALSLLQAGQVGKAIQKLKDVASKFPDSPFAKRLPSKLKEISDDERKRLKDIVAATNDDNLVDSVNALGAYIAREPPEPSATEAAKQMDALKQRLRESEYGRAVESATGLKVSVLASGFSVVRCDDEFVGPLVKLRVKNATDKDVSGVTISASFTKGDEAIGDGSEEVGGIGHEPLKPGQFTIITLNPCWGSHTDLILLNIPSITADIKVGGQPYRQMEIARKPL